jgi:hypothetical protein
MAARSGHGISDSMIILSTRESANVPFCTGLVHLTEARGKAGLFLWRNPELGGAAGGDIAREKGDGTTMTRHLVPAERPGRSARRGPGPQRRRVVSRLWRTAERHVAEIETRIAAISEDPAALERDAKTLAIIAKTIRDLLAIDCEAMEAERMTRKEQDPAHGAKTTGTARQSGEQDETGPPPRDIEDFRAELARRLDQLRREGAGPETA